MHGAGYTALGWNLQSVEHGLAEGDGVFQLSSGERERILSLKSCPDLFFFISAALRRAPCAVLSL